MTDEEERSFDSIIAQLNKEAAKHKTERDNFNTQAQVLADLRDRCNKQARTKVSQAAVIREQRDEFQRVARESRVERDKWNQAAADARGKGLGDNSEQKNQANIYHQKATRNYASGEAAHEKMSQLYEEADKLREKAEDAHNKFLACKKAADIEHEKYIAAIRKIQNMKDRLAD